MKATAVLRAVGYARPQSTSPSRPCLTSIGGVPTLCTIHQQTTWHAGWACGRAVPGSWTARERPALGWLAAHRLVDHGSMIVM